MFRFNTRMKVLTLSIGICIAFVVGSFAFANGLGLTVHNITSKFESEGLLVFEGDDISTSLLNESLYDISTEYISIGLCTAEANGSYHTLFAVRDPDSLLPQDFNPLSGEMLVGVADPLSGPIMLSSDSISLELFANRTYSSSLFPSYWHVVQWDDLERLRPEMEGSVSFLIFLTADHALIDSLRSQGLSVKEMTGILGYFSAGSEEVALDLWLIIVPAAFIVAMLVYSVIAMEIKDRSREIAILKAMGASNRQISRIFQFQALLLSVLGGAAGVVIGIIVSYAISTSSSILVPDSLFYLKVTEFSMLISFLCAVLAGVAGSLWPIYRASYRSVREMLK